MKLHKVQEKVKTMATVAVISMRVNPDSSNTTYKTVPTASTPADFLMSFHMTKSATENQKLNVRRHAVPVCPWVCTTLAFWYGELYSTRKLSTFAFSC